MLGLRRRRNTQFAAEAPQRTAADCRKELANVMRMYGWGVRGFITVGVLALLFTMVNVQIFGSAGHDLGESLPSTFHWVTAWLLDPMASVGLGVAILFEALLARYGRHETWLTVVKWFAGAMTWAMNIWPAIDHPHPSGVAAGVVLHSLAPGLVLGLAEAAPRVRRWVGEIAAELEREAQAIEAAEAAEVAARVAAIEAEKQAERDTQAAETQRIREEQIAARQRDADERAAAKQRADEIALVQAQKEAAEAQAEADRVAAEADLAKAEADRAEADKLAQKAAVAAARGPRSRTGRTAGADRRGKTDRTARTAAPPDVTDLLPAGRTVADRLDNNSKPLTRSALLAGLRSDGASCSTDRAGALLDRLNAERSAQRSGPDRNAVHGRTDRPLHAIAGGGH